VAETHGEVLRRDGVEELDGDGEADVREVTEKLAGHTKALVDLEAPVKVGVVDETYKKKWGQRRAYSSEEDDPRLVEADAGTSRPTSNSPFPERITSYQR